MLTLATNFAIGAFLGCVTGIPLGPVNFAVIDAAYRHHVKRALAVALGGATADCIYAMIGAIGVGPTIHNYPGVTVGMFLVAGVFLLAFGLKTVRTQPISTDPDQTSPPQAGESASISSGFFLGLVLILMNPGALLWWVGAFGTYFGDANAIEGAAAAVGVGVGSTIWFCFVAWAANRGKRHLESQAKWVGRIVGGVLCVAGAVMFFKGAHLLFATYMPDWLPSFLSA